MSVAYRPGSGPQLLTFPGGKPVRVWADALDTAAFKKADRFADLDCVHPHGVALMPDIHPGKDVSVGCVLPTIDALVPSAVGVDIGCGILAVPLDLSASARLKAALRMLGFDGGGRRSPLLSPARTWPG